MPVFKPETLEDRSAARKQAEQIRQFWLAKGARPKVWVEAVRVGKKKKTIYVVKSEGIPHVA